MCAVRFPKRRPKTDLRPFADYGKDDAVWDTWSDAKMRTYLVKQGVVDKTKAVDYKRHELENLLKANWNKSADNLTTGWNESDMRA